MEGFAILAVALVSIGGATILMFRSMRKHLGEELARAHVQRLLGSMTLAAVVMYVLIRSGVKGGNAIVELTLLGGVIGANVIGLLSRYRSRRRRGAPLPLFRPAVPRPLRVAGVFAGLAALMFVGSMMADGRLTAVGIGRLALLGGLAATVLGAGRDTSEFNEGGMLRRGGFLPWTSVESYRCAVFDRAAVFTFQLRHPWWLQREVFSIVPIEAWTDLNGWLSRRLPCVGAPRGVPSA